MIPTTPKVHLVAETQVLQDNLAKYLVPIGGQDWYISCDAASSAEMLIEAAGKLCYRAWKPGLNPNVTKVREGNQAYIGNVLKQRHGSIFEHASVTFIFQDVSRVFTHELVRHRVGVAISQESLRYVRLTSIPFRWPDCLEGGEVTRTGAALLVAMETFQKLVADKYHLDDTTTGFALKKKITSAMRRFAPLGLSTTLMWTTNLRNLRHVLELRTAPDAEEEIRGVFDQVGKIVQVRYPSVLQDFTRSSDGAWVSLNGKV